jgi:hypothetical protein
MTVALVCRDSLMRQNADQDAGIADVLSHYVGGPLYGASADARAILAELDGTQMDLDHRDHDFGRAIRRLVTDPDSGEDRTKRDTNGSDDAMHVKSDGDDTCR